MSEDPRDDITWYAWEVTSPDGKVSLRPFQLEALPSGCARVIESITMMLAEQKGDRVRLLRLVFGVVPGGAADLPHDDGCPACVTRRQHLEQDTRDLLKRS